MSSLYPQFSVKKVLLIGLTISAVLTFEKRNKVYLSWLPNLQNWVMFDGGYIWKNLENETKCKLGRHYTTLLCPLYFNLLYVDSFGYSDMFPALYF